MKKLELKEIGKWDVTVPTGNYVEEEMIIGAGTDYERKSKTRKFVKTGTEVKQVKLLIDINDLVNQLAYRAATSKTGKAKFMSGAIVMERIGG